MFYCSFSGRLPFRLCHNKPARTLLARSALVSGKRNAIIKLSQSLINHVCVFTSPCFRIYRLFPGCRLVMNLSLTSATGNKFHAVSCKTDNCYGVVESIIMVMSLVSWIPLATVTLQLKHLSTPGS